MRIQAMILCAALPALMGAANCGEAPTDPTGAADVIAVQTSGTANAYTFAVTLESPDTGCEQYANWWEVVTPDGELIYRRILDHSHVDEQPFTRSGGPVAIDAEQAVIVRGHMNTTGYGGLALSGSVAAGFVADPAINAGWHAELADEAPLPDGCAF